MGLGKLHLHVLMRNVGLTGSAWWHILKDEVLKLLSLLFMVAWEDAASTCAHTQPIGSGPPVGHTLGAAPSNFALPARGRKNKKRPLMRLRGSLHLLSTPYSTSRSL